MNYNLHDAKFEVGQKVFVVEQSCSEHGEPHRCPVCNGIHHAERWSPIVNEGVVVSIDWSVQRGRDGVTERLGYQIHGEARGFSGYASMVFGTLEEAHVERERLLAATKAAKEKAR